MSTPTRDHVITASVTSTPSTTTTLTSQPAAKSAKENASVVTTTTTTTTTTSSTSTETRNAVQQPIKTSVDELLKPIFYYPGMGSLVGSALSEGVYVSEKLRDMGLEDFDEIKGTKPTNGSSDELVRVVKNQANGLASDFRGLQNLLSKLPTFLVNDPTLNPPYHRCQDVEPPIHGEYYFPEIQKYEALK